MCYCAPIHPGLEQVSSDDGCVCTRKPAGGFFGELALLATARRTAQCTALANCDLSLLMAHDLVAAMRDFPESAAKVGEQGGVWESDLPTLIPDWL